MEVVRKAAIDVIAKNSSLEGALEEVALNCPLTTDLCLQEVKEVVDSRASVLGASPVSLATQMVARSLISLCGDGGTRSQLMNNECRLSAHHLLKLGATLHTALLIDVHQFIALMAQEMLPLEMLWLLHAQSLMHIDAWLCCSTVQDNQSVSAGFLQSSLVALSFQEHQLTRPIMQGISGSLVELAFPTKGSSHTLCRATLVKAVEDTYSAHHYHPPCYSVCEAISECSTITADMRWKFYSHLLSSLTLSHPCMSATAAMSLQKACKFASLAPHSADLNAQLLQGLGGGEAVRLVRQLVDQEELNWPFLLRLCASLVNASPDTANKVKDLATSLASQAVSEGHLPSFLSSLLLARQAALEGAHIMPSYSHWFKATFGDSLTTLVTTRKALHFLVRALTDIVPFEPVYCLKAHICHPPRRLAKCHSLVSDYIALAKTRLKDLKDPYPEFEESTCISEGRFESSEAAADVQLAMDHFEKCKRILPKVLEASIFKKPYFVGRFLPSLLNPDQKHQENREGVINLLRRENKIPRKMMENYEQLCKEDRSETPSTDHGSGSTVRTTLTQLVQAVTRTEVSQLGTCQGLVSKLSSALEGAIHELGGGRGSEGQVKEVVSCSPGEPGWAIELVDCVVGCVCEGIARSLGSSAHLWLHPLVTMLSGHTSFHSPLYLRLKELLQCQLSTLSTAHIVGLATLCSQLYTCNVHMQPVFLEGEDRVLKTSSDYIDSLVDCIQHTSVLTSCSVVRFFSQFLHHSLSTPIMVQDSCPLPAPATLIRKLKHLFVRSSYFRQQCMEFPMDSGFTTEGSVAGVSECLEAVESLQQIESFQLLWKDTQLHLSLWLNWELQVSPQHDYMSPHCRLAYLSHTLHSLYLSLPRKEAGLEGNVCAAFTELFTVLVQVDYSRRGDCTPASNCWGEGLQLLQELSTSLSTEAEGSCLVQAVLSVTKATAGLTGNWMRVLVCLPPHLLFSNSLKPSANPKTLSSLTHLLEHTIAPHCASHFLLPQQLTRHLLKGLELVGDKDSVHHLLQSPICLSSFILHWPHIVVGTAGLPKALTEAVEPAAKWMQGSQCEPPTNCSAEVLGTSLYAHLSTGRLAEPYTILKQLTSVLPGNLQKTVTMVVFDCCVREMTTCHTPSGGRLMSIAQACLAMEPSALASFETDGHSFPHLMDTLKSVRAHFSGCGNLALLPEVMFRVLSTTPDHMLFALPSILPVSLSAHSACLSLNSPFLHPPTNTVYQPFTAEYINDVTALTKKIITHSSSMELEASQKYCHRALRPFLQRKLTEQYSSYNNNNY